MLSLKSFKSVLSVEFEKLKKYKKNNYYWANLVDQHKQKIKLYEN